MGHGIIWQLISVNFTRNDLIQLSIPNALTTILFSTYVLDCSSVHAIVIPQIVVITRKSKNPLWKDFYSKGVEAPSDISTKVITLL